MACVLLLVAALPVCAQSYPTKTVRIIVAATPGGGTDFIARLLAQKLTEVLGQQVIVENRAGAGSTLGIEAGIKAAPDGYTFNLVTPSYSINPSLYNLKFDPLNDFTPVILVARGPLIAVVHPSVPAKNLRELIALAKARPDQLVYGSSGQGAIVHLANAQFLHMAGIQMIHVPYKGGAPALTELMAGQISLVFATPQAALSQVKAGRIRALAVTTRTRLPAEPGIPTIAEAGVPGYEVNNWHALIGPKGVPLNAADAAVTVNRIFVVLYRTVVQFFLLGIAIELMNVVPYGGRAGGIHLVRREHHTVQIADGAMQVD